MKLDKSSTMVAEVQEFSRERLRIMHDAKAAGGDMASVATVYNINLQSVKKMSSADVVAAVSPTVDGQVVVRKTAPNQPHPYSMSELLVKVNAKQGRYSRRTTSRRSAGRSRCGRAPSTPRSTAAVRTSDRAMPDCQASLADERYDSVRAEYGARQSGRAAAAVSP